MKVVTGNVIQNDFIIERRIQKLNSIQGVLLLLKNLQCFRFVFLDDIL